MIHHVDQMSLLAYSDSEMCMEMCMLTSVERHEFNICIMMAMRDQPIHKIKLHRILCMSL